MKVTLYELLGLIKDKKAPKKVLIHDTVYYLLENEENYIYSRNSHDIRDWERFIDHTINITRCLNDEVLILENNNEIEVIEEEKEIEELCIEKDSNSNNYYLIDKDGIKCQMTRHSRIIANKVNELIRYVKKRKKVSKDEEVCIYRI